MSWCSSSTSPAAAPEPIGLKAQTVERIDAGQSATAQVVYDTTGKSGERRIRVVADPHQTIVETSEADNEAAAAVMVAPPPLPNLVALETNIGFNPAAPKAGRRGADYRHDPEQRRCRCHRRRRAVLRCDRQRQHAHRRNPGDQHHPNGASGVAQIAYSTAGAPANARFRSSSIRITSCARRTRTTTTPVSDARRAAAAHRQPGGPGDGHRLRPRRGHEPVYGGDLRHGAQRRDRSGGAGDGAVPRRDGRRLKPHRRAADARRHRAGQQRRGAPPTT